MPEHKMRGELYRNIRVCVDSYNHGDVKGRYFYPALENSGCSSFDNLTRLLMDIENQLNEVNFPQSFTERRLFLPLASGESRNRDASKSPVGKRATFILRILFRQHASWQGTITWLEGEGEQVFRSVLEMILLMDSALSGASNDFEQANNEIAEPATAPGAA